MATVLKFHPLSEKSASRPETPAQRRVRIGSRLLAAAFTTLFVLGTIVLVAAIAAMLFYSGKYIRIGPDGCYIGGGPANSIAFGSLPLGHRMTYLLIGIARYAPVLMLFWHLRALFRMYTRGQVFSRATGLTFSMLGLWLCAYALSPFLCHIFLSATGYEIDKIWFHLASVQAFVLGLLVMVIGQVMQVGCEIREESERFV